jgi:RNA polymerase-binding transcription factor DksA
VKSAGKPAAASKGAKATARTPTTARAAKTAKSTKVTKVVKATKAAAAKATTKAAPAKAAPKPAAKPTPKPAAAKATTAAAKLPATPKSAKAPAPPKVPKPPAPRKPTAAMLRFFEKQSEKLREERATYTHQAEILRLEAEQLAEEMEPGDIQFDEESGEGATMNVERERDLTLSAQASAAVEEIDRALAKIEAGTYGRCEQCGQPILRARLEALPYAALCVACKSGGLSRR